MQTKENKSIQFIKERGAMMQTKENKSIQFIKDRIASGMCNNVDIGDNTNISCMNFNDAIALFYPGKAKYFNGSFTVKVDCTYEGVEGTKNVVINYEPNAEFEYFTMDSCTCDGTSFFQLQTIGDVLQKVLTGSTYNKSTVPNDYQDNFFDYSLKYTVGDFVIVSEHGDFGTKEKPWLHSKFTAYLPIKCEYEKTDSLTIDKFDICDFSQTIGDCYSEQEQKSFDCNTISNESNQTIWNCYIPEED